MLQWTGSSLGQVMACRLFSAKPLPEPMLVYCQLDSLEKVSVKFEYEFYHFHSTKCIWKCLPKWWPFCPGGDESSGSSCPLFPDKLVIFLQTTHNRHSTLHLLGWDMGCLWGFLPSLDVTAISHALSLESNPDILVTNKKHVMGVWSPLCIRNCCHNGSGYYTPRFNKVERGVYTYWFHRLSVRPSVRLWTESCPLCIFNNTCRIHFILAHLIKQLQKVCPCNVCFKI